MVKGSTKKLSFKDMFNQGFPLSKAQFVNAVNNADGTPEHYFSDSSDAPSRRVQMSLTPIGVICLHKGKYFGIGHIGSNVTYAIFKDE